MDIYLQFLNCRQFRNPYLTFMEKWLKCSFPRNAKYVTWNFEIQFIFSLFCILRSNAIEVVLTTHLFRKIIFHKQVSLCHGERLLLSLSHFLFFQELFAVWKKKKKNSSLQTFLKYCLYFVLNP